MGSQSASCSAEGREVSQDPVILPKLLPSTRPTALTVVGEGRFLGLHLWETAAFVSREAFKSMHFFQRCG